MALAPEVYSKLANLHPSILDAGLSDSRLFKIALRKGLANRNKPSYVCPICRQELPRDMTQLHHCLPIWAGGGGREVNNVMPLCGDCHDIADTLSQIGYIIHPYKLDGIIVLSPWLEDIHDIRLTDPRVTHAGRLYLAQAHVIKDVRRLVGEPHGIIYNNRKHLDNEVIGCVWEWRRQIRHNFTERYRRRLPPNTRCRTHRVFDSNRRWF
jgi:hypothetical protein